jgi:uncharacterized protein (TIGR03437 family)
LITPAAPAQPGDVIVLYATGLGYTMPPTIYGQIPTVAARVVQSSFTVQLDGAPLDASAVLYAGVTPGYAGLYQINLVLPPDVGANPQISIGFADSMSPAGVTLPVAP